VETENVEEAAERAVPQGIVVLLDSWRVHVKIPRLRMMPVSAHPAPVANQVVIAGVALTHPTDQGEHSFNTVVLNYPK